MELVGEINLKMNDENVMNQRESDLRLLYSVLKQLKMKKDLPAYITWCGNEIFMGINNTMLYHVMIDNMFYYTGFCTWAELINYIDNNILFNANWGNYNEEVMKVYNAYNIQTTSISPFYTSDTFKEDIAAMGLKAADGMKKIKINPYCFLSIFNGIIASNKKDNVILNLYLPQDIYWTGLFITKISIRKEKARISYDQYFSSLLV